MKFKSIICIDHQHLFPCLFLTIFSNLRNIIISQFFILKIDELMPDDLVSDYLVSGPRRYSWYLLVRELEKFGSFAND